MKKTDLERLKESKISSAMAQALTPGRFGREANYQMSRREQRKIDQAQGLIPFAVKLHSNMIGRLHDLVRARGIGLNELTEELLEKGLGSPQSAAQASPVRTEPPTSIPQRATPTEIVPTPITTAKPAPTPVVKKAAEAKKVPVRTKTPAAKKPAAKAKAPAAKAKKPAPTKSKKK